MAMKISFVGGGAMGEAMLSAVLNKGLATPQDVCVSDIKAERRQYLEQNVASLEVRLSAEEIAALAKAFPPGVTAGMRYPEKQLKALGI